jgi:predicted dehydrogenase
MKIKFGLIGCGRVAQRHAEQIHTHAELVSVCDIVPDKAHELAKRYGALAYTSIDEWLGGNPAIEVAVICTPNGLHAEHTIRALNAGLHVICEKPMALTSADCRAMIHAAGQRERKLFIVKQNRFNPPVVAVKRLVDGGRLGKLYSIQLSCFWNRGASYYADAWRGTWQLDGGTLFTQFSHFIDLLLWMVGDIEAVQGYTANLGHEGLIEFEDTGGISVKFRSGVIGTINYTVNSHGRNMEGSLTLFGSKGTVKIGGPYLNSLEYQDLEGTPIGELSEGNPPNVYGPYQGSMANHGMVYQNVIETLSGNGTIATDGFEGLKTVEAIEKIYASVQKL